MKPFILPYGSTDPLVLEPNGDDARGFLGPEGVVGEAAGALVTAAVRSSGRLPLEAHVVPGDRVAIALAGPLPGSAEVVSAIRTRLAAAGVADDDIAVLRAPALDGLSGSEDTPGLPGESLFDPGHESEAACLAADADGQPVHLARVLVDADVVVAVGTRTWDATIGGPSFEGDLWPAFARVGAREAILRGLARTGRHAVAPIRERSREIGWHLGLMASVRVVPGRGSSIHAVEFGTPHASARRALRRAEEWRPRLPGSARLSIATLSDPRGGLPMLARAVAAAARATHPEGTICVASGFDHLPGPVFTRWRQGVRLEPLVLEALRSGDRDLVRDAVVTRLFARALGDRRLVLLSRLDAGAVEDLGFGHADRPEVVERLAHRSDSLVVLAEADRMLPRRV